MEKWFFKYWFFQIIIGLALISTSNSFAQQRYNVVKDYGFENNDTIWVEYPSSGSTPYLTADRHYQPGYESKYCGMTDASASLGGGSAYCYLEQKLAKRAAKDYNLENNIRFFLKTWPTPASYDYWYISIESQKDKLFFLYHDGYIKNLPQEDESTHIVDLVLPNPLTYPSWKPETLNFYEHWTEKFPETDTIEKLRLTSYEGDGGGQFETVYWDDIVFESTRPDSDAAVVDIGFSGSPSANVQNKGAVAVSFPTICDIFKGGSRVYSDTMNVDSLSVNLIKQVSFKPYSDTGEMKVYTALPGDQNPGDDTLNKSLAVQEVVVKKPLAFTVWPVLTSGRINISSPNPVKIYNINGREVASCERGLKKIDIASAGVYFVKSGGQIKKIIRVN